MSILEQRMIECREASTANASVAEMQQTLMKLMAECSEKDFELEIKTADNRVLQEQLENKCSENKGLQEKIASMGQQLACSCGDKISSPSKMSLSSEYADELRSQIQYQESENEKLKLEHLHILEENNGMHVQNHKLAEEASYAKELASAAAVELKNLTSEVTKLSLLNARLGKELQAAKELNSRNSSIRKHNDFRRPRRDQVLGMVNDDFDSWSRDYDDLKLEFQARKQREATLEAALAEKEILEDDYRHKFEEARKREASLENDLANMWVLVAQCNARSENE